MQIYYPFLFLEYSSLRLVSQNVTLGPVYFSPLLIRLGKINYMLYSRCFKEAKQAGWL